MTQPEAPTPDWDPFAAVDFRDMGEAGDYMAGVLDILQALAALSGVPVAHYVTCLDGLTRDYMALGVPGARVHPIAALADRLRNGNESSTDAEPT